MARRDLLAGAGRVAATIPGIAADMISPGGADGVARGAEKKHQA